MRTRVLTHAAIALALVAVPTIRDVVMDGGVAFGLLGARIVLSALLATTLHALSQGDRCRPTDADGDPLQRIGAHRRAAVLLVVFGTLSGAYMFSEVLFDDRTMVSAPHYYLTGERDREASGFGHNTDAWAGNMIEAPGIFLTSKMILSGNLPLWNEFEGCGAPWLANGETAALAVVQLPLHLAPSIRNWNLFVMARLAVAAGLAALLCFGLGTSARSAALAGVVFAFSGALVRHANLVHGNAAMLTPLILLAGEALAYRRNFGRIALFALATGLALNGGNPQPVAVAALLLGLRFVLGFTPTGSWVRWGASLVVGGALAALLTAATLFPLIDVLDESVTRTLMKSDQGLDVISLDVFALPSDRVSAIDPNRSRWGSAASGTIAVIAALAGLAASIWSMRRCRRFACFGSWLPFFGLILCATSVSHLFTQTIPVIRDINWLKYSSATHLVIGIMAAVAVDRLATRDRFTQFAVVVAAVLLWMVFEMGDAPGFSMRRRVWAATGAILMMIIAVLPSRMTIAAVTLLPALVLIELDAATPIYPKAAPLAWERGDSFAEHLQSVSPSAPGSDGEFWRFAASRNTVPPMTSGMLGLRDIRTVSPVTLTRYHRWIRPYANSGTWPAYWLFGESRQLMQSPCLDLTGVRYIAVPTDGIDISEPARVLENSPTARWGEMLRAIDLSTLRVEGWIHQAPRRARVDLGEGAALRFDIRFISKRTRITLAIEGARSCLVRATFGDVVEEARGGEELSVELAYSETPVRSAIECLEGEGAFVFKEVAVERFLPKKFSEFRPRHTDVETGVIVLENEKALPPVRMVRATREVADEEAMWKVWERFIATGEGWKWRDELLLLAAADTPRPAPADRPIDAATSEIKKVRQPGAGQMSIDVDAQDAGWLHVAVTDDGSWRATVNGKSVPISRANGPFMAIPIMKAGSHTVRLRYEPAAFRYGLVISGVTALVLLVGTILSRRRAKSSAGRA